MKWRSIPSHTSRRPPLMTCRLYVQAADTDDLDIAGICNCIRKHGMQVA